MALIDNDYLYDKMNTVKFVGGHADDANKKQTSGAQTQPYDLESAKQKFNVMLQYRSDKIRDKYNGKEVPNRCTGHVWKSYDEYLSIKKKGNVISLADLDDAINDTTYCTCNARSIGGCECVARTGGDNCACNLRVHNYCDCEYRSGGKYDPVCPCHLRTGTCSCVSRTPSISCDCNARCSCHVVSEYSTVPPSKTCQCVSRYLDEGCKCNGRTPTYDKRKNETWYDDPHCREVAASNGCLCVSRYNACSCNQRTGQYYRRLSYDDINLMHTNYAEFKKRYLWAYPSGKDCSSNWWGMYYGKDSVYAGDNYWFCQCNMRTAQPYEHGECECVSRTPTPACDVFITKI